MVMNNKMERVNAHSVAFTSLNISEHKSVKHNNKRNLRLQVYTEEYPIQITLFIILGDSYYA